MGVSVLVEPELAERTGERCAGAALHREHRPRDLCCPFVVEDAERRQRFPSAVPAAIRGRWSDARSGRSPPDCHPRSHHRVRPHAADSGCRAAGRGAPLTLHRIRRRDRSRCHQDPCSRPGALCASSGLPSRWSWPTSLEMLLTRARMSSRSAWMSRRRASSRAACATSSMIAGRLRRESAAFTPSRSVRSSRWSITASDDIARRLTRPLPIRCGVDTTRWSRVTCSVRRCSNGELAAWS